MSGASLHDELVHNQLLSDREIALVDTQALRQLHKLLEVAHAMATDIYERSGPRNGPLWKERTSDIDNLMQHVGEAKWRASDVLDTWAVEED